MTKHRYTIVTLDLSNQRRYHILTAETYNDAQATARARHSAETGAPYDEIYAGERTLKYRVTDVENDLLIGSGWGAKS